MEAKSIWDKLQETFTSEELSALPVTVLADIAKETAVSWARKKLGLDS